MVLTLTFVVMRSLPVATMVLGPMLHADDQRVTAGECSNASDRRHGLLYELRAAGGRRQASSLPAGEADSLIRGPNG